MGLFLRIVGGGLGSQRREEGRGFRDAGWMWEGIAYLAFQFNFLFILCSNQYVTPRVPAVANRTCDLRCTAHTISLAGSSLYQSYKSVLGPAACDCAKLTAAGDILTILDEDKREDHRCGRPVAWQDTGGLCE